jgi:hypothetical protein
MVRFMSAGWSANSILFQRKLDDPQTLTYLGYQSDRAAGHCEVCFPCLRAGGIPGSLPVTPGREPGAHRVCVGANIVGPPF